MAINTFDCSRLSAGYLLAIGCLCPKISTLQDIVIYYVPKLHMAAITILNCSVFTRFLDKLRWTDSLIAVTLLVCKH